MGRVTVVKGRDARTAPSLIARGLGRRGLDTRVGKTMYGTKRLRYSAEIEHGTPPSVRRFIPKSKAFRFRSRSMRSRTFSDSFVGHKRKTLLLLTSLAGSGTTAHAVMRLNKQDNGHGGSASVVTKQRGVGGRTGRGFAEQGFAARRPRTGRRWGICEYLTKPRLS